MAIELLMCGHWSWYIQPSGIEYRPWLLAFTIKCGQQIYFSQRLFRTTAVCWRNKKVIILLPFTLVELSWSAFTSTHSAQCTPHVRLGLSLCSLPVSYVLYVVSRKKELENEFRRESEWKSRAPSVREEERDGSHRLRFSTKASYSHQDFIFCYCRW